MRFHGCRRKLRFLTAVLFLPALFTLVVLVRMRPTGPDVDDPDVLIPLRSIRNQREYIDKRGLHVVVGHYVGDDAPWVTAPNLTDEILNSNMYAPRRGAGDDGQPVYIPSFENKQMQHLYHINKFNLMASDRISVNRTLPDVRKKKCLQADIDVLKLPQTSMVIVFHNEAWSTLLRTVHSVINRSPRRLLHEILLVDDSSDRKFLKDPLDEYVSKLPVRTRVIRSRSRVGLIRARLLGARVATGEVLVFLDAHCECTKGWLENLLVRIAGDRTRVVCPVIDIINDDTFAYVRSFELHWGTFNWQLHFRWYTLGEQEIQKRRKNIAAAFRTPVMAGGLFAIDKNYFFEMGAYDEEMDIWGGENIEISFRIWMCGGSIEIAPCSHVGHVFRKSSPYTFPREGGVGGVLHSNLARVALVWMDEWKEFFFKLNPEPAKVRDKQSVSKRLELRKKLQCHNFKWYLDNIWPEHFLPKDDRFFGKIHNRDVGRCLVRPPNKSTTNQPTGSATLSECVIEAFSPQLWVITPEGFVMTDESLCLDAPQPDREEGEVRIMACSEMERQRWKINKKNEAIIHLPSGKCLDSPSKTNPHSLTIHPCTGGVSQQWKLEEVEWRGTEMR